MKMRALFLGCMLGLFASAGAADDLQTAGLPGDLTELSLDDLLNVEVTSVSKHAEPLSRAAAAVYVITGEELQRAGARSIAEALRMVPGVQVARSNANAYKISARGFDSSADKLQVLVDGRSVYTPLTSAVFWDVLDTHLRDIDRIEVIRGPGATLWGANAVNGVVNIITKSATETVGGVARTGGGNEEQYYFSARQGFGLGDAGAMRLSAKAWQRDDAVRANGSDARDGQRLVQGGLRADFTLGAHQQLSVSGDGYSSHVRTTTPAPSSSPDENHLWGGNLLTHWTWAAGERSTVSALASYDRYRRFLPKIFGEVRGTFDLGLQHDLWLGANDELTYGLGYRNTRDRTDGTLLIVFEPGERTMETYSAFVQNQLRFGAGRFLWTLGSKFEHNDVTGYEVQPGTRLGYSINEGWFTWASVSRAVRTPNRLDQDVAIFCPPPSGIPGICGPNTRFRIGTPEFESEKLNAWEWGLRYTDNRFWSIDLATYYNDYRDLRSSEGSGLNIKFRNLLEGHASGAELALTWRPVAALDFRLWQGFIDLQVRTDPSSTDANTAANIEGSTARHQAGLRAAWQPLPDWNFSVFTRYVGHLRRTATPSASSGPVDVPAYTELQLRTAWRPWSFVEFALTGANLLDSQHPEFGSSAARNELERSLMFEANWQWR